jgi:anti-sigma factor RsiW
MNDRTSCDEVGAGFVIDRYVAGTLSESETAAFEAHLLTCERCQQDIPLAVAIREAVPELKEGRTRRLPWFGPSIITLAAAAALTGVLLLSRDQVPDALTDLGRVTQPPVYLGVAVRQTPSRSDSLFDEAMAAYVTGDFATAATGLPRALAAGADTVPVQFFAGASLLMTDGPAEAAEAFRSVIRGGDTPYSAEARYYLAKALLRLGRTDEARSELRRIAESASEIAGQARALADSIEARVRG